MPALRGVFHCAGALDDATIGQLSWDQVAAVLAAKVDGALLLDELTRGEPLDHFVLYASIASLLGSRGQANHAAANAFLDAIAHQRRAAGRPALSIDWGAWSEVGAAADRGVDQRVALQGIGIIAPDQGLAVLDQLLDRSGPQVGVSPVHWPAFLRRYGADGPPPYFAEMATEAERRGPGATAGPGSSALAAQLAAAAPERRVGVLGEFVRQQVVRVLGLPADQLGDQTPLSDLGLDSLMAVELRNLLGAALGPAVTIPATLVFDHPTIDAMTRFLAAQVLDGDSAGSALDADADRSAATRAAPSGALVASMLDDLENLSDEEIDAQIARRSAR
jgi:aryl carrier-like protein